MNCGSQLVFLSHPLSINAKAQHRRVKVPIRTSQICRQVPKMSRPEGQEEVDQPAIIIDPNGDVLLRTSRRKVEPRKEVELSKEDGEDENLDPIRYLKSSKFWCTLSDDESDADDSEVEGEARPIQPYQVCSRTLARSSHVWAELIDAEPQVPADGLRTIWLGGDDPLAIQDLLNIVHGRFSLVPCLPMTIFRLYAILDTSEKYDMLDKIHPWINDWGYVVDKTDWGSSGARGPRGDHSLDGGRAAGRLVPLQAYAESRPGRDAHRCPQSGRRLRQSGEYAGPRGC